MTTTTQDSQKYWAVLPAAGIGKRMLAGTAQGIPKQYLEIQGKTILQHTLETISRIEALDGIVLVLAENDSWWSQLDVNIPMPLLTVTGGSQRADSVVNGLHALTEKAQDKDWVLVHDVVRPCVRIEDINKLIETLVNHDTGGILATPVTETLKEVAPGTGPTQSVTRTVPREHFWLAGTPQMFRYGLLKTALEDALKNNASITDEAHAMENAGHVVTLVPGSKDNIKVTHEEDLFLAESILDRQRLASEAEANADQDAGIRAET